MKFSSNCYNSIICFRQHINSTCIICLAVLVLQSKNKLNASINEELCRRLQLSSVAKKIFKKISLLYSIHNWKKWHNKKRRSIFPGCILKKPVGVINTRHCLVYVQTNRSTGAKQYAPFFKEGGMKIAIILKIRIWAH